MSLQKKKKKKKNNFFIKIKFLIKIFFLNFIKIKKDEHKNDI